MLVFKRSRETERKKKLTDLVSRWRHDKTNTNLDRSAPHPLALTKHQQKRHVIVMHNET